MSNKIKIVTKINQPSYNPETQENMSAGDIITYWSLSDSGKWEIVQKSTAVEKSGDLVLESEISSFSLGNFDHHGLCSTDFPPINQEAKDRLTFTSNVDQNDVDNLLNRSYSRDSTGLGLGAPVSALNSAMVSELQKRILNPASSSSVYVFQNELPIFANYKKALVVTATVTYKTKDDVLRPRLSGAGFRNANGDLIVWPQSHNMFLAQYTNISL